MPLSGLSWLYHTGAGARGAGNAMEMERTRGQCRICGKSFTKAGMARHIRACRRKLAGAGVADGLLVALEDRSLPSYWLVVEVAPTATWDDLDDFLRRIWVECCGHLSCFEAGSTTFAYDVTGAAEWADDPRSMEESICDSVAGGSWFHYEYDFGTTTALLGRVLAAAPGGPSGRPIEVLARNDPPQHRCVECGHAATAVCGLCYQGEDYPCWYCDSCRARHLCGDPGGDYFLPVVNSPRVGLCGYDGPANG